MSTQTVTIGEKIRTLRYEKGLSLTEVAQKTGLSPETISDIEELKVSPPLGDIINLAKAFHVTVGDLFGDDADSPFCLVRSDGGKAVSRFGSTGGISGGYSYQSLGYQKQDLHMEPFLVTLAPSEAAPLKSNQHEGEEILFVLEGQVEIELGDHTDILGPGDSIYYDSNLPHVVSCHGNQPAKLFAVIYTKKEMVIF